MVIKQSVIRARNDARNEQFQVALKAGLSLDDARAIALRLYPPCVGYGQKRVVLKVKKR